MLVAISIEYIKVVVEMGVGENEYGCQSVKSVPQVEATLARSATDFGKTLAEVTARKDFIDLASGAPSNSLMRVVAEALGARRYLGIESQLINDEVRIDEQNNQA